MGLAKQPIILKRRNRAIHLGVEVMLRSHVTEGRHNGSIVAGEGVVCDDSGRWVCVKQVRGFATACVMLNFDRE